jgi:hypothetical protein
MPRSNPGVLLTPAGFGPTYLPKMSHCILFLNLPALAGS